MFEKNLLLTELYDIYSALLTDSQRNMFELYYTEDLSLSEIAENTGITRQGVHDSLKHTEEALLSFEEKLGLLKKNKYLKELISRAYTLAKAGGDGAGNSASGEMTSLLDEMSAAI